jgi:hypothetical protein
MKTNKINEEMLFTAIGNISDDCVISAEVHLSHATLDLKFPQPPPPRRRVKFMSVQFAGLAAAMLLVVGIAVMLRGLSPDTDSQVSEPPVHVLEPVVVPNETNFRPIPPRNFALPTVSESDIENMSAATLLSIAHDDSVDFDFPDHFRFDDFGVPLQVSEACRLRGEHERIEIVRSADSRESAEQQIIWLAHGEDNDNYWTVNLRIEYIGENELYFSFRVQFTTVFCPNFVERMNSPIPSYSTSPDRAPPTEYHNLYRAIVFRHSVYNHSRFNSGHFPQETLDDFDTMLHVLDLLSFDLRDPHRGQRVPFDSNPAALSVSSPIWEAVIHRNLEEFDDRFVYTYYRFAAYSLDVRLTRHKYTILKADGIIDRSWDSDLSESATIVSTYRGALNETISFEFAYASLRYGDFLPPQELITDYVWQTARRFGDSISDYICVQIYTRDYSGIVTWRVMTPERRHPRAFLAGEISLAAIREQLSDGGDGSISNLQFFVNDGIVIEISSQGIAAEELWRLIQSVI